MEKKEIEEEKEKEKEGQKDIEKRERCFDKYNIVLFYLK